MPVHAPITVFDERWPFRKIFSRKERKKRKYESCNSPLWSSFPWSYFFHGDWLFSRAAVSPSLWWFCTRARTRTRYGRTRSASCPAPCAAGCPARGWICGIDLWSACALSPARLSSPRSRPGSLTFCFDKETEKLEINVFFLNMNGVFRGCFCLFRRYRRCLWFDDEIWNYN